MAGWTVEIKQTSVGTRERWRSHKLNNSTRSTRGAVVLGRGWLGPRRSRRSSAFVSRGKAIALHSQVIGDFCTEFGIDTKMKQSLIRRAKANGGKLGFLA